MVYNAGSMLSGSSRQQARRLVIGITGRIGAGKTSVGKYLAERHGFSYVRYSQVLSDWMAKDPESKAHLQVVGWEVMAGGMQEELNKRLIAQIEPQHDCAVDGLRHRIDYDSLSTTFSSELHLMYVASSETLRWQRLRGRYPTLQLFQAADSHPVEQQIESLRSLASVVIENDGSLADLYGKVDTVLSKVRGGQS